MCVFVCVCMCVCVCTNFLLCCSCLYFCLKQSQTTSLLLNKAKNTLQLDKCSCGLLSHVGSLACHQLELVVGREIDLNLPPEIVKSVVLCVCEVICERVVKWWHAFSRFVVITSSSSATSCHNVCCVCVCVCVNLSVRG